MAGRIKLVPVPWACQFSGRIPSGKNTKMARRGAVPANAMLAKGKVAALSPAAAIHFMN